MQKFFDKGITRSHNEEKYLYNSWCNFCTGIILWSCKQSVIDTEKNECPECGRVKYKITQEQAEQMGVRYAKADPSYQSVEALQAAKIYITITIIAIEKGIIGLDTPQHAKAMTNKLNAVLYMIDAENRIGAVQKIRNDIAQHRDWVVSNFEIAEALLKHALHALSVIGYYPVSTYFINVVEGTEELEQPHMEVAVVIIKDPGITVCGNLTADWCFECEPGKPCICDCYVYKDPSPQSPIDKFLSLIHI